VNVSFQAGGLRTGTQGGNYLSLHETEHVADACVEGINHCVCRTCCCCDPDLPSNIAVSNVGENFEMPSVT